MKIESKHLGLAALATGLFTAASSQAAVKTEFDPGDLILGFQIEGSTNILMVNLGASITYRDASSNILNIFNIGSQLTTLGGASWFDNGDLYFGIAGMRSSTASDDSGTNTGAFGLNDPNRTAYFSKSRLGVGSIGVANSGSFSATASSAASQMLILANNFDATYEVSGIYAGPASTNTWEDFNPFAGTDTQGTAFTGMPGGIQQNFGAGSFGTFAGVGAVEGSLDLWRDSTVANAGVPEFLPAGSETYQGSFTIDNAGNVSYIAAVPEPSSAVLLGSTALLGCFIRRRQRQTA